MGWVGGVRDVCMCTCKSCEQMLFYESAKCLHGRMTELKGKYYGSLFVHYQASGYA